MAVSFPTIFSDIDKARSQKERKELYVVKGRQEEGLSFQGGAEKRSVQGHREEEGANGQKS